MPNLPPTSVINARGLYGAGNFKIRLKNGRTRRVRGRKRGQKGGFFSGAAKSGAKAAVNTALNRLKIKDINQAAGVITKSLINNAIDVPIERFNNFKNNRIRKIKSAYKEQVSKLPNVLQKVLT